MDMALGDNIEKIRPGLLIPKRSASHNTIYTHDDIDYLRDRVGEIRHIEEKYIDIKRRIAVEAMTKRPPERAEFEAKNMADARKQERDDKLGMLHKVMDQKPNLVNEVYGLL